MRKVLIGVALLILSASMMVVPLSSLAQDPLPIDPFWDVLGMVPDDEVGHGEFTEITYTNYQLMYEAWQVADVTYEDVQNETDKSMRWLTFFSAFPFNLRVQGTAELISAMQDTMGFSMLDVHQILNYGWPPVHGIILTGDFDRDAIRTALTQRDFAPVEVESIEVWCGVAVGCDGGREQDVAKIDESNIFGGFLGREEPLAVQPGVLLDSPALPTLIGMIGVQIDRWPSLLDVPEYHAFAETITAQGTVLEIYSLNPDLIYTWERFALPESVRENVLASVRSFGVLPAYDFFGFAHVWADGEFYTQIVLIYDDATVAESAAQEVHTRLMTAAPMSVRNGTTYQNWMAEVANGELVPPTVYEGADFAAAVIGWRWNVSNDEPLPFNYPFSFLRQLPGKRDLYFLGIEFVLPN